MDTPDTPEPQRSQSAQPPLTALASTGQEWLASRLLHRQVVNASTLAPVGRVSDVVFNPESRQVTALIVRATATSDGLLEAARRAVGRQRAVGAIGIDHIIALNGDVVIADSDPAPPAVRHAAHPAHAAERGPEGEAHLCDVCELTIITLHGICLGVLADVLLDERGTLVTGYVVNPTRYAETTLLPLGELEPSEPPQTETGTEVEAETATDGSAAAPASESSDARPRLRVIPATPRVRIGESLILVLDGVEPLHQEVVTVKSQPAREHLGHPQRYGGVHWRWATRRARH